MPLHNTPESLLAELGADRRALGERLQPELLGIHNRPHGSPVRTYRYGCGHIQETVLLVPPKECLTCCEERYSRETREAVLLAVVAGNVRRACQQANRAHDYGRPHLICQRCVESVKADMAVACERWASMFSKRVPRGFRNG